MTFAWADSSVGGGGDLRLYLVVHRIGDRQVDFWIRGPLGTRGGGEEECREQDEMQLHGET